MGSCGKNVIRPYQKSMVPRLKWTPELHHSFLHAIHALGGHQKATPKLILEMMDIRELHISHVKSHLQMYRTMKNEGIKQDPNFTGSRRRKSVEDHHDGCLDHEHRMMIKPNFKDSHPHTSFSHSSKRVKMETGDVGDLSWQQPPQYSLFRPSIHQECDLLKILGERDGNSKFFKRRKFESSKDEDEDEDGLLLTLSLPSTSTQRSSNGSSMSDISEAYSTRSVNDGTLKKPSLNLDLSIGPCGNGRRF